MPTINVKLAGAKALLPTVLDAKQFHVYVPLATLFTVKFV